MLRARAQGQRGSKSRRLGSFLALFGALALAGCTHHGKRDAASASLGERGVSGRFEDLRITPDESFATYLAHARKPHVQGLPPKMVIGELWAFSLSDGKGARRLLGEGVTNLPGGYLFSPDSKWAVMLTGYNVAAGAGVGKAVAIAGKAPAITLGQAVSDFSISPDSKWVAVVDGGLLKLFPLGGATSTQVGKGVLLVKFSPDSSQLLFRQKVAVGGGLWVAPVSAPSHATELSDQVTRADFSPDSKRLALIRRSPNDPDMRDLFLSSRGAKGWSKPRQLAHGTDQFAFSPDGRMLARSEGARPDKPGALVVGPASGAEGRKLVDEVHAFRFAPDSKAIAAIFHYENRFRAGKLGIAALPKGVFQVVGHRVGYYGWSPKGHWLAFSARIPDPPPILSYDLFLAEVGSSNVKKLARGGYGFLFSPDGKRLLYRTRCTRGGRGCDLDSLVLGNPKAAPRAIAEQVFSYDTSPDGQRILYTYAHPTSTRLYDARVLNLKTERSATVGRNALLPALFAAKDGSEVVYLKGDLDAPGLYTSDRFP